MAGGLAHELSQPLGAIANNARAGLHGHRTGRFEPSEIEATFQAISEDAQRAGDVIRSLRAFISRTAPARVECDLNAAVRSIVSLFERGNDLHLMVEQRLDPSLPTVFTEPVQLQQAIVNLLQNASDAMAESTPEARWLAIETQRTARGVVLRVIDAGHGIGGRDAESLYDSYYTTKSDGLGLGLNIVRLIVEEHGGRTWISQNPDGGATAHIALPAR